MKIIGCALKCGEKGVSDLSLKMGLRQVCVMPPWLFNKDRWCSQGGVCQS